MHCILRCCKLIVERHNDDIKSFFNTYGYLVLQHLLLRPQVWESESFITTKKDSGRSKSTRLGIKEVILDTMIHDSGTSY